MMHEYGFHSKMAAFLLGAVSFATQFDLDNAAVAYVLFALLDTVAGLIYYGARRRLRSRSYIDGLIRKTLIILFIAAVMYLERSVLRVNGIATATAVFYIVGEVLSIAEKLVSLGAPVPRWLRERLGEYQQLQRDENGGHNDARAD